MKYVYDEASGMMLVKNNEDSDYLDRCAIAAMQAYIEIGIKIEYAELAYVSHNAAAAMLAEKKRREK